MLYKYIYNLKRGSKGVLFYLPNALWIFLTIASSSSAVKAQITLPNISVAPPNKSND